MQLLLLPRLLLNACPITIAFPAVVGELETASGGFTAAATQLCNVATLPGGRDGFAAPGLWPGSACTCHALSGCLDRRGLEDVKRNKTPSRDAQTASDTWPLSLLLAGIVGASIGMPDIHSGYGFAIGEQLSCSDRLAELAAELARLRSSRCLLTMHHLIPQLPPLP